MGANAVSRLQTQRDVVGMSVQVRNSPFDSVDGDRHQKPSRNSLTRKRSLVQIQYGPRFSKTRPPRGSQKGSQKEAKLASSSRRDGVH